MDTPLKIEIPKILTQSEGNIGHGSQNLKERAAFTKNIDKIVSYGQKAIPILSEEMKKSKSPTRRLVIACALARIGGEEAESVLIENASDPSAKVRAAIAFSLGEFDSEKSRTALSYMVVYDISPDVRQAAILSLGRLGNEKALEVVKNMLNDKNPVIREAAQTALDRINANKKGKN